MKMSLTKRVKPGKYAAAFLGVHESHHEEYGSGARWEFRIEEGEFAGTVLSRTTKELASPKNTCGKFLEMVAGMPLEEAVQHDTDAWSGQPGVIIVEASPSGDTLRVAEFIRA